MYCVLCGEKKTKWWSKEYRICTQKCSAIYGSAIASTGEVPYCEGCGEESNFNTYCLNCDGEDYDQNK